MADITGANATESLNGTGVDGSDVIYGHKIDVDSDGFPTDPGRIVYDIDSGGLFYDSNSNAAGGATHLASLTPNLALTNADFVVI